MRSNCFASFAVTHASSAASPRAHRVSPRPEHAVGENHHTETVRTHEAPCTEEERLVDPDRTDFLCELSVQRPPQGALLLASDEIVDVHPSPGCDPHVRVKRSVGGTPDHKELDLWAIDQEAADGIVRARSVNERCDDHAVTIGHRAAVSSRAALSAQSSTPPNASVAIASSSSLWARTVEREIHHLARNALEEGLLLPPERSPRGVVVRHHAARPSAIGAPAHLMPSSASSRPIP